MSDPKNFGNVNDYLLWRGDLKVSEVPWCTIDSLLTAILSYQQFDNLPDSLPGVPLKELVAGGLKPNRDAPSETQRIEMIERMAAQPRFANMRLSMQESVISADLATQFSAVTCMVEDGPCVIAYRGTDHTLVGWKEDFMMSYCSPIPAQTSALQYLNHVASLTQQPLVLTGHSKGGNLASYAGAKAGSLQKRIIEVASFDGPGLDDETISSEDYLSLQPVVHSVIPNGSIVGLLMNFHPVYTVVQSTAVGLFQHDAFTWKIMGGSFIQAEETTFTSQLMNETVHQWLNTASPAEIQSFVEILFTTLEKLYPNRGAEDLYEIKASNALDAASYIRSLQSGTRDMIVSLLQSLFMIGRDNYLQMILQKPLQNVLDEFNNRILKASQKGKEEESAT